MTTTLLRLDIEALKRDKNLLLSELGLSKEGAHCKCPFHQDSTGSLNVNKKDNGVWLTRCGAGCVSGSIIDVRKLKAGLRTDKEAIESLAKELGMSIHVGPPKPTPPKIKLDEATAFVKQAQKNLEDFEVFERWAVDKRGFKNLSTIQRLGLGFVENYTLYGTWCVSGWIISITDPVNGQILFVKCHTETRFHKRIPGRRHNPEMKIPKCFPLPFGKRLPGQEKAQHAFKTIWPNPELFGEVEDYFYHGGELKAAVAVDHGYAAGSPTSGEGGVIHPDDIRRIKAKRIWICYDDEEGKEKADGSGVRNAGLEWCEAHLKAFMLAGFDDVRAITYGEVNDMERFNDECAAKEETKESLSETNDGNIIGENILRGRLESKEKEAREGAPPEGSEGVPIHGIQRNIPRDEIGRADKGANETIEAAGRSSLEIQQDRTANNNIRDVDFEIVSADDLDALEKAFANSTLINIPKRNPNAPEGMTENYYKKFNAVCGQSEYVKPNISMKELEMLEWMKSYKDKDFSRRVHPDWIEQHERARLSRLTILSAKGDKG